MSRPSRPEPVSAPFWTPYVYTLLVLMALGLVAALARFIWGLGAVTNLSDRYPWGIWKAVSVAAGVALATGGFTTAALVHVFHRERYEPVVRSALLVALLGYTYGATSLFVDLGRYYNIWHPMWPSMWQGDSALFEVAICIMTYMLIMYVEFMPIVCERFIGRVHLQGALAAFNGPLDRSLRFIQGALGRILSVLLVAGVVISCMHHSSLGSLMLIARYKLDSLWYTPVLPLLFLLSVFAAGFAVVTAESLATTWVLGRRPRMEVLRPLSNYTLIFLGVYLIARVADVLIRGVQGRLLEGSLSSRFFLLEVGLGFVAPFLMLASRRVRRTPEGLMVASGLIIFGIVMNRANVFITAYQPSYAATRYFPSLGEVLITVGLLAFFAFLHRIAVGIFPVVDLGPRSRPLRAAPVQASARST
ncbi:MAG: Ni/Fe-hydrogenase cytochrome b subunit [Candidatus Omnitrophica bacterium]|nr:putative Ni/Fe-hydrogenase 2 b-type cytochrome subunit [bacterium]NUN98723.1 Ni/Fe-hydrogenase cytochrome b subunit [Candidatus Omnitrophota bacterium]